MKTKSFIFNLIFVFIIKVIVGQIGYPVSTMDPSLSTVAFRSNMNSYILPNLNNTTLQSYADSIENSCTICPYKNFFGKGLSENKNLKTNAQYYNPNIYNGELWIYKITSPSAKALSVYFNKFILPKEAQLFIYNSDRSITFGPFTSVYTPADTTKAVQFGTPLISGQEFFLEYFEPHNSQFNGHINIGTVMHVFSNGFGHGEFELDSFPSADCNINVACKAGWADVANSVAIQTVYDDTHGYIGWCTGTLLNNTAQDGEGYYLTASHCIANSNQLTNWDPSTYQFYFDYQQTSCNPQSNFINYNKIIYGATVLAQDPWWHPVFEKSWGQNSDYALLKLNSTKENLISLNLCYSGWDKKPIENEMSGATLIGIHHPMGDYKKITTGNNLNILPANISAYHNVNCFFKMDITSGALQSGSSGSGLFLDANKRLIGHLWGTSNKFADPCPPNNAFQIHGRFSKSWELGNFAQWLDPLNIINTNNTTLNGKCFIPTGSNPSYDFVPTYPAPPYATAAYLQHGFKLNGVTDCAYICDDPNQLSIFSITPKNHNRFIVHKFRKEVACNNTVSGFCQTQTYLFKPDKCECEFYTYKLSIDELNFDLTTKSRIFSEIIEAIGTNYLANININPYTQGLVGGKYYKITIETLLNAKPDIGTIKFYIIPDNFSSYTPALYTANLYAKNDLLIIGGVIDNNIDVIANNEIRIVSSQIKSGHLFNLNTPCQSYYRLNGSENRDSNTNEFDNFGYSISNDNIGNFKTYINNIIPNPNNGDFVYRMNANVGGYIEIRDALGASFYKENVAEYELDKKIVINQMKAGLYFLTYYDKNNKIIETQKVVINAN